jgi:heme-degrading monooxygenase HmoA
MYATIQIRQATPERPDATRQGAATDGYPDLQQAHGFVAHYVVAQEDGAHAAITFWQTQAQAQAFRQADARWSLALARHGHRLVSDRGGEVITRLLPRA